MVQPPKSSQDRAKTVNSFEIGRRRTFRQSSNSFGSMAVIAMDWLEEKGGGTYFSETKDNKTLGK